MQRSIVVFDKSGSMWPFDASAQVIATAILSTASPTNLIGLITFNDRVHINSYYTSHPPPTPTGLPQGRTELMDALMVALCADDVKPDNLFVISDRGENASEVALDCLKLMLRGVKLRWIKPPPSALAPPILPFLVAPPGRMKLLEMLGAQVDNFSTITDNQKFIEAVTKLHDSFR